MLKLISKLQLPDDGAYPSSVSGDGRRIAACARSGKCRLFDDDLRQLDEIELGIGAEWVHLDESGGLLLVGFASRIDGYTTSGNIARAFEHSLPKWAFQDCVLNAAERVVCVALWNGEGPKISALDLSSGKQIDETPLPARGEGYTLVGHPEVEAMAANSFDGSGDASMFWVHYAHGRLRVYEQPEIEDLWFPCFHPTGRELVSRHALGGLRRVRFPSGEVIAGIEPEQAFPDNPDFAFSHEMHFLDDGRLLASQDGLSLYEFDLGTLSRLRPVLTGVDGMTFGEEGFYCGGSWPLAGCRLLTADWKQDPKSRNRADTLRLWDASTSFGRASAPDPARPYTAQLLARDA